MLYYSLTRRLSYVPIFVPVLEPIMIYDMSEIIVFLAITIKTVHMHACIVGPFAIRVEINACAWYQSCSR
jgi:hypothetical protein